MEDHARETEVRAQSLCKSALERLELAEKRIETVERERREAINKLRDASKAGKAMFQMLGVFAEFERGIIRERVNAGLARARANGVKLGRRRVKPSVEAQIGALRDKGYGILKIGKELGVGTSVVQRVFKEVPWR